MILDLTTYKEFENVIVCGDIHGEISQLVFKINQQHKLNNSLIIVAGDVGIGFYKDGYYTKRLTRISERLKKQNNLLLFVRGNHDNPEKWMDYEPFKEFWQENDSNVRFVKDYTVIQAKTDRKEYNILCVGGAISIDRKARTKDKDYWPNEIFVYDEKKVEGLTGITHVITHSAPNFCEPLIKSGIENWMELDKELEADCDKERADHTLLYEKLQEKNEIKMWAYGHYHFASQSFINGVQFRLCRIMELVEL